MILYLITGRSFQSLFLPVFNFKGGDGFRNEKGGFSLRMKFLFVLLNLAVPESLALLDVHAPFGENVFKIKI